MTPSYKNCEYELKCNEPFMTLQDVALHSLLFSQADYSSERVIIRAQRPMITKSSFFQTKFVNPCLDLNPTNKKRALYYFANQRSQPNGSKGSQPNPKGYILDHPSTQSFTCTIAQWPNNFVKWCSVTKTVVD